MDLEREAALLQQQQQQQQAGDGNNGSRSATLDAALSDAWSLLGAACEAGHIQDGAAPPAAGTAAQAAVDWEAAARARVLAADRDPGSSAKQHAARRCLMELGERRAAQLLAGLQTCGGSAGAATLHNPRAFGLLALPAGGGGAANGSGDTFELRVTMQFPEVGACVCTLYVCLCAYVERVAILCWAAYPGT